MSSRHLEDLDEDMKEQLYRSDWFGTNAYRDMSHCMVGLAAEVGEVATLVNREIYRGVEQNEDKWMSELGDALWYLRALVTLKGFTLEQIVEYNDVKLHERCFTGTKGDEVWRG